MFTYSVPYQSTVLAPNSASGIALIEKINGVIEPEQLNDRSRITVRIGAALPDLCELRTV